MSWDREMGASSRLALIKEIIIINLITLHTCVRACAARGEEIGHGVHIEFVRVPKAFPF